jgi:hypothetical protein
MTLETQDDGDTMDHAHIHTTHSFPEIKPVETPRPARVQALCIREATVSDLVPLVVMSSQFFDEANWKEFTNFNPEGMKTHFEAILMRPFTETGHFIYVCEVIPASGVGKPVPIGFIKCCIQWASTTEPLGVLDAVYIEKTYRLSHAGRALFNIAENRLREVGCCVFFAAPGARLGGVDTSMSNMLGKLGFETRVSHGCKILKPEPETEGD